MKMKVKVKVRRGERDGGREAGGKEAGEKEGEREYGGIVLHGSAAHTCVCGAVRLADWRDAPREK